MGLHRTFVVIALILSLLTACSNWTTTITVPDGTVPDGTVLDGTPAVISRATFRELEAFADEDDNLPLERVLYTTGYRVIETLYVTDADGATYTFDWATVAETAKWHKNGTLTIDDATLRAATIEGTSSPLLDSMSVSLMDVAPTAAAALGLPAPAQATGHDLTSGTAQHVLLLFLDGFGYLRYTEARDAGLIPVLSGLEEPAMALTLYPPATAVASAALLTGASPDTSGVLDRGIRTTDAETLFDVVTQAGHSGVAVEGNALAFNMRNADLTLSGDRDGNGSTDDNVRANALDAISAGMPDLLWIHFHGIDDAGHTYGVDAPEERAAISEVDAAVGDILAAIPPHTLVLIFADHGMHTVEEEGRLGNHGNLVARDMLVPLWILDF